MPEDDWLGVSDPTLDLSKSITVAGTLHIIHNSTKNIGKNMKTYDDTVSDMSHVANLVRRKATQGRLLETCFSYGVAVHFKADIMKFDGKVNEERWGTIAHCVLALLAIEVALRRFFSLDRYGRNRRGMEFEGGDEAWRSEVEVVDRAIHSNLFWDALRVLFFVARLIMGCISSVEACACHFES